VSSPMPSATCRSGFAACAWRRRIRPNSLLTGLVRRDPRAGISAPDPGRFVGTAGRG
jgi:hypothetical protein